MRTELEYQDTLAETLNTLRMAKAIAGIYCNKYVASADIAERVQAMKAEPETQQYVFMAIIDFLHEAEKRLEKAMA